MKTKVYTRVLCEVCEKEIEEGDGLVVWGNIHELEGNAIGGGLIGNAFPKNTAEKFLVSDVVTFAYHKACLKQTLFAVKEKAKKKNPVSEAISKLK